MPVIENGIYPGYYFILGNLHRHTGILIQNLYLIFGGQSILDCSSDLLYIYDFDSQTFRKSES